MVMHARNLDLPFFHGWKNIYMSLAVVQYSGAKKKGVEAACAAGSAALCIGMEDRDVAVDSAWYGVQQPCRCSPPRSAEIGPFFRLTRSARRVLLFRVYGRAVNPMVRTRTVCTCCITSGAPTKTSKRYRSRYFRLIVSEVSIADLWGGGGGDLVLALCYCLGVGALRELRMRCFFFFLASYGVHGNVTVRKFMGALDSPQAETTK